MSEKENSRVREDSDRILINIRDAFRGSAVFIGLFAGLIPDMFTTTLLGGVSIFLWGVSTRFHPSKARVLDIDGDADSGENWICLEGRFFGRPFEIGI